MWERTLLLKYAEQNGGGIRTPILGEMSKGDSEEAVGGCWEEGLWMERRS